MINTTSERLKAGKVFIFQHFWFNEQLKFHAQLSWARKKFYNLGARFGCEIGVPAHNNVFSLTIIGLNYMYRKSLQKVIYTF